MQFVSVAVLAVLVCAVAVYAVPSSSISDDSVLFNMNEDLVENTDKTIQKLRQSIDCTVDTFGIFTRTGIYKVFGKLFAQYKGDAEKLLVELKSCTSETNADLKAKCTNTVYIKYIYTTARLDCKLEGTVNGISGYQIMRNLNHYCAIKN